MRKKQRRLMWEATQGAERIVLIREGRLLLASKTGRTGRPVKSQPRTTIPAAEGPR